MADTGTLKSLLKEILPMLCVICVSEYVVCVYSVCAFVRAQVYLLLNACMCMCAWVRRWREHGAVVHFKGVWQIEHTGINHLIYI